LGSPVQFAATCVLIRITELPLLKCNHSKVLGSGY
jgi:hypothetical protein